MVLVAGVDSSTQACKVVVRDAESGTLVRSGRASHPSGTEVDPREWEAALQAAVAEAGGLDDVDAVGIGAQQHGMIVLDDSGEVVRPALLWNDTRSAAAAVDLVAELGGGQAWADAVGVVPVAAITVAKLRWLAESEPSSARRAAAVCLPHDWLSWRLLETGRLEDLQTDRSDASGTGYWSADTGYRDDLLRRALGHVPAVPVVLGPSESAGRIPDGTLLAPGAGDNAAAALALGAEPGDVVVSLGTSGVASAVSSEQTRDGTGVVAGFADAAGRYLPLACTLNAAQVLDAMSHVLGVSLQRLSEMALAAPAGAGGAVLVPYMQGERTPNLPLAAGALHGLTLESATPEHLARASIEGMLCGLADAVDAVARSGPPLRRVILVGGAAQSPAVRLIASAVLGLPVVVPPPGEYVADGVARQAAWACSGQAGPPSWPMGTVEIIETEATPFVRERYAEAQHLYLDRVG